MVVSPFAISTSQTITSSAKNYTTPHPITPILDFKTGFVFLEKEKDNSLEKSNCCSVKTYIDSVSVKAKQLFDNEFNIFKPRSKDLVTKSNTGFNDKHLQEKI